MSKRRIALSLALATISLHPVFGQSPPPAPHEPNAPGEGTLPTISLGVRLTPDVLGNLLDRAADKLREDYQFDEFQYEQTRQMLREYVPRFLSEHQEELQSLIDDAVAMRAGTTPPSAEYVADVAKRALPMLNEFRGMVDEFSADFREILDEDQEVLLDGYVAAFDVGTGFARQRLNVFAEGGFDPKVDWYKSPTARQLHAEEVEYIRQQTELARQDAMQASRESRGVEPPPNQPGAAAGPVADAGAGKPESLATGGRTETDEWTRYVEDFIVRYQLNDEQSQKARLMLEGELMRRSSYLSSRAERMQHIESLFKKAENPQQLEIAEKAYAELVQPVDRMFENLKRRLNGLPTRAQRKAAEQRAAPDEPEADPPRNE